MTNAPALSSQAVPFQKPDFTKPPSDPMGLAGRLLAQFEEDLAHGDNQRAHLVNTAIMELIHFLEPRQVELVERQIEKVLWRVWGCCFR